MAVFEKILRHALGPLDETGTTVALLDAELRSTYAALPEILRPRPMADSVVDPPANIVTRLCIVAIYDKSLCVLHRPYAVKGHPDSVHTCYEASSELLRYYCDAFTTFQPGGQNESEQWFLGSITWNDFLTATTVLCLVVCVTSQSMLEVNFDKEPTVMLLSRTQSICTDQVRRSKDTRRVVKLLEQVISRFGGEDASNAMLVEPFAATTSVDAAPDSSTTSGLPIMATTSGMQPSFGNMNDAFFDDSWMVDDVQNTPIDDPSWVFLEQFLQLPDGGLGPYQ